MSVDSTDLLNKRHLQEGVKDHAMLSTYPSLGAGEEERGGNMGGGGGDEEGAERGGGGGGGESGGGGGEGGGGGGEGSDEMTFDDIVIYDRRPLHVVNPHLLAVSSHRDDRDRDGEGEGNGEVKGGGKGNGEGKGGVKGGGEGGGKGKGGEGDGDCRMKVSLVIVTYGNGVATSLLAVDRFYATNPGTTLTSLASIVCPLCTRQT